MELVLWRHAEAEPGEPDLGRALTGKGEKQARRVAQWLHAHLPDSARILVSPARRAQQTAQALAELSTRKLKTVDTIAPGASADDLLAATGWPRAAHTIVVVGHQPTLGWLASRLVSGAEVDWPIKKGALWWLDSNGRGGIDRALVRAVVSPDLI
jgi:phosphohistidine phosphatase